MRRASFVLSLAPGALLCLLLAVPFIALLTAGGLSDLLAGMSHPSLGPALRLSLWTSVVSLGGILVLGTPLAWQLSRARASRAGRAIEGLLQLPVVMPPAVIGIALLLAYGRAGALGDLLSAAGLALPFTAGAVVVAQTVVAAPFYVLSAVAAFEEVDDDLLAVAHTLGASHARAFFAVAVPAAAAGLVNGAALAWARALGEFGATLLFAGNLVGRTQTMPLAIYSALETDVSAARALSVLLAAVALTGLVGLRALVRVRR